MGGPAPLRGVMSGEGVDASARSVGTFNVVTVSGEVDLHTSPRMRELLLGKVTKRRPHVVLDLGAVTYMDSSGVATLLEGLRRVQQHDGRLVLVGLADRVREVLEVARLLSIFELADSVENVLAAAGES